MKKAINKKYALRLLGSILFVFFALRSVEIAEVSTTLQQINVWIYLGSFLLLFGNRLLYTIRWNLLLQVQDIDVPFWSLFHAVLYGTVFNRILPTTFGGDTARVYWLLKDQPNKKAASVIATLADKVLGLISLVILALLIVPFNPLVDPQIRWLGFGMLILLVIVLAGLLWGNLKWFAKVLQKMMFTDWLRRNINQAFSIIRTYKNAKISLVSALFISLLIQSVNVVNQYLRFATLDIIAPLIFLFLAIPLTTLILTIPISLGGVGLREITLINLLGVIGIESQQVVAYSIVGYSQIILLSIVLVIYNLAAKPSHNLFQNPLGSKNTNNESEV